jgi:hypothetical protein
MKKFVLVIYSDNDIHDLIGPFDTEELAYSHVDKVRAELDGQGISWAFSVWPLIKTGT